MSEIARAGQRRLFIRSLRIVSGLVVLTYVTCHLINASLGVISNEAMDAARPYLTSPWGKIVPGILLLSSLLVHFLLGLYAIYQRPTLRTNTQDMIQILSSVLIMPLMAIHGVGSSIATKMGAEIDYALVVKTMWVDTPWLGLLQVVMLTVVWVHGAAGLITWLRSREGARAALVWVYPLAVVIPIAALLGFSEAGRRVLSETASSSASAGYGSTGSYESSGSYGGADGYGSGDSYSSGGGTAGYVTAQSSDQGYGNTPSTTGGYGSSDNATPPAVDFALINRMTNWILWGSALLAALTFAARFLRLYMQPHQPVQVIRDAQAMATAQSGLSLLDIFRQNDQPHASLCEGRGRCATCAVRILSSEFPLTEPDALEIRTLVARDLPDGVRLACQVCPSGGNIEVAALYPPDYTFDDPKPDVAAIAPSGGTEAPA